MPSARLRASATRYGIASQMRDPGFFFFKEPHQCLLNHSAVSVERRQHRPPKRETPAAFETTGVFLTYRKSAEPSMNRSSFFEAATPGHSRCCHNLNFAAPPPD
jgi:hypothetical protein